MNQHTQESLDAARVALLFQALIKNAFDVIKVVGSSDEAIPIIRESYQRWLPQERVNANAGTSS